MLAEKYVNALLCPYSIHGFVKDSSMHARIYTFRQKDKTIPSHYDNPFCSFKCASYALNWMDKVNNHSFGEPSHLTKYMRVKMIPF